MTNFNSKNTNNIFVRREVKFYRKKNEKILTFSLNTVKKLTSFVIT